MFLMWIIYYQDNTCSIQSILLTEWPAQSQMFSYDWGNILFLGLFHNVTEHKPRWGDMNGQMQW